MPSQTPRQKSVKEGQTFCVENKRDPREAVAFQLLTDNRFVAFAGDTSQGTANYRGEEQVWSRTGVAVE